MKIISDYFRDIKHSKENPGSYEWWYFDALSNDGYGIVVIFYEGNPFSRRYIEALNRDSEAKASAYPAISISVYKDQKPIYYSFTETSPDLAIFSADEPKGNVKKIHFSSEFSEKEIIYTLKLDQDLPNGDSISGDLVFSSKQFSGFETGDSKVPNHSDGGHLWNLVQPIANVVGKIKIEGFEKHQINFQGVGYHDHNVGSEPMKESFREWYWGRYHFDTHTLVYYLMDQDGKQDYKAWLINTDGNLKEAVDIDLKERAVNVFGLSSSRIIEVEFPEFQITIQKDCVLDSGPFYQRFRGSAVMHSKKNDIRAARGISEFIYPSRIYNKLFWPLVDMRINYPGKAHWVQKSQRLYRWTW